MEQVENVFAEDHSLLLRKVAPNVGFSVCRLWKILRWDMKDKFYKNYLMTTSNNVDTSASGFLLKTKTLSKGSFGQMRSCSSCTRNHIEKMKESGHEKILLSSLSQTTGMTKKSRFLWPSWKERFYWFMRSLMSEGIKFS